VCLSFNKEQLDSPSEANKFIWYQTTTGTQYIVIIMMNYHQQCHIHSSTITISSVIYTAVQPPSAVQYTQQYNHHQQCDIHSSVGELV